MAIKGRLIGTLGVLAWLGQGCAVFDLTQEQLRQRDRVATEPPPTGTMAFHVIGAYQGRPPPGSGGDCLSITEPECQQMLLHQVEHRVDVRVGDTGHNLVLGLSAHEKTHWHLNLEPGVTLSRVILSGVYPQRISGVGAGVQLDYFVEEISGCGLEQCGATGSGFYDYRAPAQRYEQLVPLPPTSFEGHYEQGWFELEPGRAGVYPR